MGEFWPDRIQGAVSLTFDDARYSQIQNGIPMLDRYGVSATFYLSLPAVRELPEPWREATAAGHEIGNHTATHPCSGNFDFAHDNPLENYTLAGIEREIEDADAELSAVLDVRPTTFAYPCGQTLVGRGEDVSTYVPLVARRFLAGRGYNNGAYNRPDFCDPAHLRSVGLDGLTGDQALSMIRETVAAGGWLVFTGHEIDGDPEQKLQTSGETLARVLQFVTEDRESIWTDTVENIATYVCEKRTDSRRD